MFFEWELCKCAQPQTIISIGCRLLIFHSVEDSDSDFVGATGFWSTTFTEPIGSVESIISSLDQVHKKKRWPFS